MSGSRRLHSARAGPGASFRRIRRLDEVGMLGSVPQLPVEVLVDGGGGCVAANRPASARHTRAIRSSVMIQCDSTANLLPVSVLSPLLSVAIAVSHRRAFP